MTPSDLAIRAYEISEGAMIKETCFGLQVTGTPDDVDRVIAHIRSFDPNHIFVKDRGFPPGDPRRCRANLGGARPGYFGHEFEISLVRFISKGLESLDRMDREEPPEEITGKEAKPVLDIKRLKELIEKEEP